jgi:hypothetical protein
LKKCHVSIEHEHSIQPLGSGLEIDTIVMWNF